MSMKVSAAVIVVIGVVAIGCGSGSIGDGSGGAGGGAGESGATGGAGDGGGPGTGGDTGPGDAAMPDGDTPDGELPPDGGTPTNASCLQLRICVSSCMDAACVQRCLDLGSPAGRTLFQQLQTCSKTACPDQQDRTCRCEAECIFPGACTDLQDMCADGVTDPFCLMCA